MTLPQPITLTANEWQSLREVQLAGLLKLDDVCGVLGLRYQLAAGTLLAGPAQGEILLWQDRSGAVLGYGVLCAGFSLEQGGAFGLIDELFLKPQARGRGRAMLETLAPHAGDRGWAIVRLEVNRHNAAARRMYLAAGFRDEARDLLTRAAGAGA